jgi:pilus assembly protein CpaE
MTNSIRTTIALGPVADRDTIEAACLGEPSITVTGFVSALPGAVKTLGDHPNEALVVACSEESEDVLGFIAGAVGQRPDRPVVVLYAGTANGFVRRAIDAGADDLVTGGVALGAPTQGNIARDIAFALEKALARRAGHGVQPARESTAAAGEMITVLGPKGGTGKTLTACNLGAALAKDGHRVVIVDLDLQFGDVGLALGLAPDRTLYELATSGGSLDQEKVEDFLKTHASGVQVLMAPSRPDQAGAVGVEFLRDLFETLRSMADYVIVDTPPGFTPEVIAAIDRSTEICMVAMLDAPSLKNTKLGLETLDLMQYDRSRIKVVLNRADSRVGVTTDDVGVLLGRSPDVLVPSSREITRSVNEATPIVTTGGNAEARRAFEALAAVFGSGSNAPEPEPITVPTKRRAFRLRRAEA